MKLESLSELLEDQLKDLYNAENQLLKALPKMVKNASSESLAEAIQNHLEETRGHVERLTRIGQMLEIKLTGKKCKAMEGLLEEGKEVLEADGEAPLLDSAMIAAAQRVEHYEISAYGTARTFAEALGHTEVAELLQETLDEEEKADKLLTEISVQELLPEACQLEEEESDEAAAAPSSPTRQSKKQRSVGSRSR